MKKIEINFSEKNIEPFFKVLGRNGVKEAVVNIFTMEEGQYPLAEETRRALGARIEFYCPDTGLEAFKKDIVDFAKNKWDTFRVEILALEEKINILTKEKMCKKINDGRMTCL